MNMFVRNPAARLDRANYWCFRRICRSNYDSQLRTALGYPFSIAFEWQAWRQLRPSPLAISPRSRSTKCRQLIESRARLKQPSDAGFYHLVRTLLSYRSDYRPR